MAYVFLFACISTARVFESSDCVILIPYKLVYIHQSCVEAMSMDLK